MTPFEYARVDLGNLFGADYLSLTGWRHLPAQATSQCSGGVNRAGGRDTSPSWPRCQRRVRTCSCSAATSGALCASAPIRSGAYSGFDEFSKKGKIPI